MILLRRAVQQAHFRARQRWLRKCRVNGRQIIVGCDLNCALNRPTCPERKPRTGQNRRPVAGVNGTAICSFG
jgi:hypothetical protein